MISESLGRSHSALKTAELGLVLSLMYSGQDEELAEAYDTAPRLKRLGFVGAEEGKLEWVHGLLAGAVAENRKTARMYLRRALHCFEALDMIYSVTGVKADLAALYYPRREPIGELFKDFELCSAPEGLTAIASSVLGGVG